MNMEHFYDMMKDSLKHFGLPFDQMNKVGVTLQFVEPDIERIVFDFKGGTIAHRISSPKGGPNNV
jgi:hypothetical protein